MHKMSIIKWSWINNVRGKDAGDLNNNNNNNKTTYNKKFRICYEFHEVPSSWWKD